MILTAAFIISKAIGATWSWWYIILAILADYEFQYNLKNINKK